MEYGVVNEIKPEAGSLQNLQPKRSPAKNIRPPLQQYKLAGGSHDGSPPSSVNRPSILGNTTSSRIYIRLDIEMVLIHNILTWVDRT